MSCLSEGDVADYVEHALCDADTARVEAHLDACEDCRKLVVALLGDSGRRPRFVDRYIVLNVLGAGAAGIVYEAFDPKLNRKVALKLVHVREESKREALLVRLEREAIALAKVQHPNVIAVYDIGKDGENLYIAMQLAEGQTLREYGKQPRAWPELARLFACAAEGLAALHRAGLVHRDIKPDNIFVNDKGQAWLGDLGLARVLDASVITSPVAAEMTLTQAMIGTPAYMAPEQLRGEVADARADVFSLCATFCESVGGDRPFAGNSPDELLAAMKNAPRLPARAPRWFRGLLRRGLAIDPAARSADAAAIAKALTRDRTRVKRRLATAALGVVAAAVLGFWAERHWFGAAARCAEASQAMARIWSPEVRATLAVQDASAPLSELDRFAGDWVDTLNGACRATFETGRESEPALSRQLACLDDAKLQFQAMIGSLAASVKPDVATALARLPSLEPCSSSDALLGLRPFTFDAGSEDKPMWSSLTSEQQGTIRRNEPVIVATEESSVFTITVYRAIHNRGAKSDPEGASAALWDIEDQASYLKSLGIAEYRVLSGRGTAAVHALISGVGATGAVTYTEDVMLNRTGRGGYLIAFYTTNFDQTPAPGMIRMLTGHHAFEHFPGDGGGALMRYKATLLLTDAAEKNGSFKATIKDFLARGTALEVEYIERGPTLTQLLRLRLAVFPR